MQVTKKKTLCPCRQCRPPQMTLPEAMRRATRQAQIDRYGKKGYEERKAAERKRLDELKRRKNNA